MSTTNTFNSQSIIQIQIAHRSLRLRFAKICTLNQIEKICGEIESVSFLGSASRGAVSMKPWAGSRKARRMARRRERNQGTSQCRAKGECEPGDHQAPQPSPRRQRTQRLRRWQSGERERFLLGTARVRPGSSDLANGSPRNGEGIWTRSSGITADQRLDLTSSASFRMWNGSSNPMPGSCSSCPREAARL